MAEETTSDEALLFPIPLATACVSLDVFVQFIQVIVLVLMVLLVELVEIFKDNDSVTLLQMILCKSTALELLGYLRWLHKIVFIINSCPDCLYLVIAERFCLSIFEESHLIHHKLRLEIDIIAQNMLERVAHDLPHGLHPLEETHTVLTLWPTMEVEVSCLEVLARV